MINNQTLGKSPRNKSRKQQFPYYTANYKPACVNTWYLLASLLG